SFLTAQGVKSLNDVTPAHVADFVNSRRSSGALATLSERHSRRGAVRMLFKEARRLGLTHTNPAHDVDLPARQPVRTRPLDAPEESLIVWRSEPKTLRASCSQAVTETLQAAELHGPDVRPRSIVAWAGRRALDSGAPIDRVTLLLGMRSMDEAADFLCFDWR